MLLVVTSCSAEQTVRRSVCTHAGRGPLKCRGVIHCCLSSCDVTYCQSTVAVTKKPLFGFFHPGSLICIIFALKISIVSGNEAAFRLYFD